MKGAGRIKLRALHYYPNRPRRSGIANNSRFHSTNTSGENAEIATVVLAATIVYDNISRTRTKQARQVAMENIIIRRGRLEDAQDFSELALHTGPELLPALFGANVKDVWTKAFRHPRSCFSYEHSHFIEVNGKTEGMALAYSYDRKRKEEIRSLLLILRYLKWGILKQIAYLSRSGAIIAQIDKGDYYISNIAVYPDLRCRGYGTKLLEILEGEAKAAGCTRLVLDVETDNEKAVRLYERTGYIIEMKSPVLRTRERDFEFFKMVKDIAVSE